MICISYVVMQGLDEINPAAAELEESNALALAIISPGSLVFIFHVISTEEYDGIIFL